jgi:biopolymer transport protein ExbB/TolQ
MGFLGTVVGITMAIANVTPEQLDSSLPEVTAGLAVAFDTTAQALGMSMILVFGTFLIERGEQNNLNEIEQFGIDQLVPSLTTETAAAQATGIPALTDWTAQMLTQQTEFWNRHLMSLQTDWAQSLTQQTDTLAQALNQETQQTLQVHRESIDVSRDQYAASLQQSTHAFTQLIQMTESEERLAQLQEQLNKNLQTLQIVATLEQTVNSLNAAVNVLTAKTALRVAA